MNQINRSKHPWIGHLAPRQQLGSNRFLQSDEFNREQSGYYTNYLEEVICVLDRNPQFPLKEYRDVLFRYDVVANLHDPTVLQGLNLRMQRSQMATGFGREFQLKYGDVASGTNTDYVLARRINGQLVKAAFYREDKRFCFSPRISATGKKQSCLG